MGIFPIDYYRNYTTTSITSSSTPDLLKEYAVDFDTGEILVNDDGTFTIVEGLEAVKVRCWLALQIQRNRYLIYPSGIGNDLKSLVGKDLAYINKNIENILDDALVDSTYVNSISDISCTLDSDSVTIEFTINSIYGSYTDSTTV